MSRRGNLNTRDASAVVGDGISEQAKAEHKQPRHTDEVEAITDLEKEASFIFGPPRLRGPHRQLQLELHTTGAYAVQAHSEAKLAPEFDRGKPNAAQHRLFKTIEEHLVWTPVLSGRSGGWMQAIVVIAAAVFHTWIVSRAERDDWPALLSLGPPLLAVTFVKLYLFIIAQEQHRLANRPPLPLSTPHANSTIALRRQIVIVVFFYAPLLSLRVRPTAQYVTDREIVHLPRCFSVDHLTDYLYNNSAKSYYDKDDHSFLSEPGLHQSPWSASPDPTWQLLPADKYPQFVPALNLTHDDSARRPWLRGRAAASYALYEPLVVDPGSSLPAHLLSSTWESRWSSQRAIVGSLVCKQSEILSTHTYLDQLSQSTVEVPVTDDDDGCQASLTLMVDQYSSKETAQLRAVIESYRMLLNSSTQTGHKDPYLTSKVAIYRRRLDEYVDQLTNAKNVASIRPQWLRLNSSYGRNHSSICQSKFIVVVPESPFVVLDKSSLQSKLRAASCVTRFVVHDNLMMKYQTHSRNIPFRQLRSQFSRPEMTDVNLISADSMQFRRAFVTEPISARIADFYQHETVLKDIFDIWYPFQLIEYEFAALSKPEEDVYLSIAYAADQLLSRIFRDLSIATGVAPLSCTDGLRGSNNLVIHHTYHKVSMVQTCFWFRLTFYGSVIMLLYSILRHHMTTDDSPSGLPWDISSIAARAVILCGSRLRKCFASRDALPGQISQVDPVRIGFWSHSEDIEPYAWRVDSLLNECKTDSSHSNTSKWIEHDFYSLPTCARPLPVLSMFAVTILTITIARWASKQDLSVTYGSSLVPILLSTNFGHVQPSGFVLCVQLWSTAVAMALCIYWWSALTSFYKMRLPWAELRRPSLARRCLTLNYTTSSFPVYQSVLNGHWMLTTMMIGSVIMLFMPVLVSQAFESGWRLDEKEFAAARRALAWREDMNMTNPATTLNAVVQDSVLAWRNSSVLPRWSSFSEALAPIDLNALDSLEKDHMVMSGYVGYWQLQTESIRADLQCSTTTHKQIFEKDSSLYTNGTGSPLLALQLKEYHSASEGFQVQMVDPCFNENLEATENPPEFCSRWQLVSPGSSVSDSMQSTWIISTVHRSGKDFMSQVLTCRPRIIAGVGNAQMTSTSGKIRDAVVHRYLATTEKMLSNEVANTFSVLLNQSIHPPKLEETDRFRLDVQSGLRFSTPAFSSSHFRGDILSFMVYREMTRNDIGLDDVDTFKNLTSKVFSTIFSIAAHKTDLFKVPVSGSQQSVPITELIWHEVFTASPLTVWLIIVLTVFLLLTMIVHVIIMMIRKEYRFPIAPEPLENSWFFLYRSSIVDILARKIKSPQNLTLKQFNARVERLGHRYVFARESESEPWTCAKVDIVEAFAAMENDELWAWEVHGDHGDGEVGTGSPEFTSTYRDDVEDDENHDYDGDDIPLLDIEPSISAGRSALAGESNTRMKRKGD